MPLEAQSHWDNQIHCPRAESNSPWLSVSLMAENAFCPRAAVIQFETPEEEEDTGEDRKILANPGQKMYLTLPELERVLEEYQALIHQYKNQANELKEKGKKQVPYVLGGILIGIVAWLFTGSGVLLFTQGFLRQLMTGLAGIVGLASVIGFFVWAVFFVLMLHYYSGAGNAQSQSQNYQSLYNDFYQRYYLPAKNAAPIPVANHIEPQKINWWSFIRAGYEPRSLREGYRHERCRLAGRPWKILVKGNLRIPVFRKRLSKTGGEERIYYQHKVRMTAYCHLIFEAEGRGARDVKEVSPYGIVLFGNTYEGMTVPVIEDNVKILGGNVKRTRETIEELKRRVLPPAPTGNDLGKCKNCPHSWRDRHTGQSVCGTRFGWTPPNARY